MLRENSVHRESKIIEYNLGHILQKEEEKCWEKIRCLFLLEDSKPSMLKKKLFLKGTVSRDEYFLKDLKIKHYFWNER
jgi:hypothetical protein